MRFSSGIAGTCALWVMLSAGCSVRASGEFGAALCSNVDDDDGDGLWDCEDPDCWPTDTCNRTGQVTVAQIDASLTAAPEDAGNGADAHQAEPSTAHDEDSGNNEPDALPLPLPLPCDTSGGIECGEGEICSSGACVPDPFEKGVYLVRIASAFLPLRSAEGVCLETLLDGCPSVLNCDTCFPDAYVIAEVNGDELDRTTVDWNAVAPAWYDDPFEVSVVPGKTLTLRVMDDDAPTPDVEIFSCQIALELLPTANGLQCVPDRRPPAGVIYQVSIDVSPKPRVD